MMAINAGVVYKTRFIQPDKDFDKVFDEYINYIDRDEAVRNKNFHKYSVYNDYMENPEKSSGLFNESFDQFDLEQKKLMKEIFEKAQNNGSLLWQDVISFDNQWLEKHGLYDPKTNLLDEGKLREVTRVAMNTMLNKEHGKESMIWTAAIHTNTDNIHIHIAYCEPIPTRTRGKKKPKTMDAIKSTVVNEILQRKEHLKEIDRLLRNQIVDRKKDVTFYSDRQLKRLFFQVYHDLPEDRRQWNYNQNSIRHLRPMIDEMSRRYIEKYHATDFIKLTKKLDQETLIMKEAYGEGKKEKYRYENLKNNKINNLYTRLGNAILKEMREYAKEEMYQQQLMTNRKSKIHMLKRRSSSYTVNRLRYYMNKEYESWKNQRYYERLEDELERG